MQILHLHRLVFVVTILLYGTKDILVTLGPDTNVFDNDKASTQTKQNKHEMLKNKHNKLMDVKGNWPSDDDG